MASTDIKQILDGIDRRLALGEIDLATYHAIKAKYTSFQGQTTSDPLESASTALPREVIAIKCPGCMAPLPVTSDSTISSVICEYCGGTFALQTAAAEMDRLRADIRRWLSEMAGGGVASGTVDEASRRFIFRDRLLPSLQRDANRATEVFALFRHGALFSFPLTTEIPSSPFLAAARATPDSSALVDRLKMTVARADSPEILAFAVGDNERADLARLQVICQEPVHLANVRRYLLTFDAANLGKVAINLAALKDLYSKAVGQMAPTTPLSRMMAALARRVEAVHTAVLQLKTLHTPSDGFMTGPIIADLDAAATQCDAAAADLEASGAEPREQVPAAAGSRDDALSIRILADTVRLFGECGAETGYSFTNFLQSLRQFVTSAREPSASLQWLASFLSRLAMHVESLDGNPRTAALVDFAWVNGRAASQARSSFFGGREVPAVTTQMLVPHWVVEMRFAVQSGIILHSGKAAADLLFIDASRTTGGWFAAQDGVGFAEHVRAALASPSALSSSAVSLVPVTGPDRTLHIAKQIIGSNPRYTGGQARFLGLAYLPAAVVTFSHRKSDRVDVFFPIEGISVPDLRPRQVELASRTLYLG